MLLRKLRHNKKHFHSLNDIMTGIDMV